MFSVCFEFFRVFSESKPDEKEEERFVEVFKAYTSKTNFLSMSEGILSLGYCLLEKLSYLDYPTSNILTAYLFKIWVAQDDIRCSTFNGESISNFSSIEDILDFL